MYFVARERIHVAIISLSVQKRDGNVLCQEFGDRGLPVDTLNSLVQSRQQRAYGLTSPTLQDLARHVPVLLWYILLGKLLLQCLVNLPDNVCNVLATQYHNKCICTKREKAMARSC